MLPRVRNVRHLGEYRLEIAFTDGVVAEIDFARQFAGRGGVFGPFQSVEFFSRVEVDKEAGTIVWPNGVDLCPDVLYARATGKSIDELADQTEVKR